MLFKNRADAGKQLALKLAKFADAINVVVVGIARGGIAVAFEIASTLHLPLALIVVRKVSAPENEELALGAITDSGEGIFNNELISFLSVSDDYIKKEVEKEKELAASRVKLYTSNNKQPDIRDKTVILVDDGVATGATIRAAIQSLKKGGAKELIVAIPVASGDSLQGISKEVAQVVVLSSPSFFEAVGNFYENFAQVSDEEILDFMQRLNKKT